MSGLINELSVDHAIVNDCRQLARGRALRVQHQPAPDGDAPASAWMSPNFKPPGSAQVADQPTAGIATFASTTEPPAATTRPSVASARTARRHRSAASQQRRRPDQDADCQRRTHPVADRRSARRAVPRRCRLAARFGPAARRVAGCSCWTPCTNGICARSWRRPCVRSPCAITRCAVIHTAQMRAVR